MPKIVVQLRKKLVSTFVMSNLYGSIFICVIVVSYTFLQNISIEKQHHEFVQSKIKTFMNTRSPSLFGKKSLPYVAIYFLYLLAASNGLGLIFQNSKLDPMMGKTRTQVLQRYNSITSSVQNIIKMNSKRKDSAQPIIISDEVTTKFVSSNCKRQKEILATINFEFKNQNVSLQTCASCFGDIMDCHRPTENAGTAYRRTAKCEYCIKHKSCRRSNLQQNMLPVWTDKHGKQFFCLPLELMDLTFAEKLLIQKNSALVPCIHMFKGQLGIKGHTVMFPKNLTSLCTDLPRQKLEIIKVLRQTSHPSDNDTSYETSTFKVRKSKVMKALLWLKDHHSGYKDITIREENLDWLENNEEGYFPPSNVQIEGTITEQQQESVSVHQTDPFFAQPTGKLFKND